MSEGDVKELLTGLESRLEEKFADLKNDLLSIKNTVIQRLVDDNKKLRDRVYMLESEVYKSQQYSRRNNIEVNGIPDSVTDDSLEDKAIDIFQKIDVTVGKNDIEACHRLGKKNNGSKTTILKFVNRRKCEEIIAKRKKLGSVNMTSLGFPNETAIFVHLNSCPYYSHLSWKCRKLRKEGLIYSTWQLADGTVVLKESENSRYKKITHEYDLDDMFPNFSFDNDTTTPPISQTQSNGDVDDV